MTTKLVHVNIIKDACELYLEAREERITLERELLIQESRGPYRSWFRWRHRTRSQAILEAKRDDEWDLIAITGGHWAARAENILSLCRIPGKDMITLDREDATFLAPWVDRTIAE